MVRSTYREGDFAAFGDLLGEHSQEVQYTGMALDVISKARDHGGQDILPRLHLDGQDGQADAELDPDGLGARRELLEENQNLAAEGGEVAGRDLCREIVRDLPRMSVPLPRPRFPGVEGWGRVCCTFPLSVVAANICATASVDDCRIVIVADHASFCRTVRCWVDRGKGGARR